MRTGTSLERLRDALRRGKAVLREYELSYNEALLLIQGPPTGSTLLCCGQYSRLRAVPPPLDSLLPGSRYLSHVHLNDKSKAQLRTPRLWILEAVDEGKRKAYIEVHWLTL